MALQHKSWLPVKREFVLPTVAKCLLMGGGASCWGFLVIISLSLPYNTKCLEATDVIWRNINKIALNWKNNSLILFPCDYHVYSPCSGTYRYS